MSERPTPSAADVPVLGYRAAPRPLPGRGVWTRVAGGYEIGCGAALACAAMWRLSLSPCLGSAVAACALLLVAAGATLIRASRADRLAVPLQLGVTIIIVPVLVVAGVGLMQSVIGAPMPWNGSTAGFASVFTLALALCLCAMFSILRLLDTER